MFNGADNRLNQKLHEYLNQKSSDINAKIIEVKNAKTVNDAVKEIGCERREIIKSIVFLAEGKAVIAIVDGKASVDKKRIRKQIGVKDIRIATSEEVVKLTGYPAGGVPPIGHNTDCIVLLDKRVLENEWVYGGGGDDKHLSYIKSSDIAERSTVCRIRK